MQSTKYRRHGLVLYFIGYLLQTIGEALLFISNIFNAATMDALMIMLPIGMVALSALGLIAGVPFLGIIVPLVFVLIGVICYVVTAPIGSLLSRAGKTLTTKRAEELLKDDSWRPVLYLRSFVEDRVAAKGIPGRPPGDLSDAGALYELLSALYTPETEEEVLGKELNRIGLCVAVGIPGERLPPIGIPRLDFDHDNWEKGVEDLMKRSELVVLRAGTTKGVTLELDMAVKYLDPRKLIILLPLYNVAEFGEVANKVLPKKLPKFSVKSMAGSSLAGVIHFDSSWTPKVLMLSEVGNTLKDSLETVLKRYSNYGKI
jgi:hypothetical protein